MRSPSTHHARILVLHFTLNNPFAESLVVCRRRNLRSRRSGRIVAGMRHSQRPEYFTLAESVERLPGDSLEGNSKQNETNIAVFRTGSGIMFQRNRKRLVQK